MGYFSIDEMKNLLNLIGGNEHDIFKVGNILSEKISKEIFNICNLFPIEHKKLMSTSPGDDKFASTKLVVSDDSIENDFMYLTHFAKIDDLEISLEGSSIFDGIIDRTVYSIGRQYENYIFSLLVLSANIFSKIHTLSFNLDVLQHIKERTTITKNAVFVTNGPTMDKFMELGIVSGTKYNGAILDIPVRVEAGLDTNGVIPYNYLIYSPITEVSTNYDAVVCLPAEQIIQEVKTKALLFGMIVSFRIREHSKVVIFKFAS
jgi:hypothetical protein